MIVSARAAALLNRPLRRLLREARERGERIDDEVLATVAAIDRAGHAYASERVLASSEFGMSPLPLTEAPSCSGSDGLLSTSEVADRLGCGERNVVRLISERRLSSVRRGRMHLVDPGVLARYMEDISTG